LGSPALSKAPLASRLAELHALGARLRASWAAEAADSGSPAPRSHVRLLVGIVALAALLRFATLDARSFWVDEGVVINLVNRGFGDMVSDLVTGTEGTPPLYYMLAWAWTEVFGTGEVGLRSLSAVLGTAVVPVAYLAGRELVGSRVGLVAAVFAAASPIFVWHAQDGRSHSLALLLAGVGFVFFLRALRQGRRSDYAWWAVSSGVALFSHYYTAFAVAPEALLLLLFGPARRLSWAAVMGVVAAGLAVVPIALAQRGNVDRTYELYGPLGKRLVQTPAQLLVGEQPPLQRGSAVVAALLVLVGLWALLRHATGRERNGAAIALTVGIVGVVAMLAAAAVGVDYISARNVLPTFFPLLLVAACGFAALRAPPATVAVGAVLVALWLAIDLVTAGVPKFEREDWRGAAEALGPATADRAVVVTPYPGRQAMRVYLEGSRPLRSGARVSEIDVVGLPPLFRRVGVTPSPPRPAADPPAPPGFRRVERREGEYFTVLRYRASRALPVDRAELSRMRLGDAAPSIIFHPSAG
jgi:mannosyltransferase